MIIEEQQQTNLNNELDVIFSEIEASENISFNINYVQLNRDKLDESFMDCKPSDFRNGKIIQ